METKNNATKYEKVLYRLESAFGVKNALRLKTMGSILRNPMKKIKMQKQIRSMASHNKCLKQYSHQDFTCWENGYLKMMIQSNEERFMALIDEFYKNPLKELKRHEFRGDGPVVICLVKDEIYRMKEFFRHYRELGAAGFVLIDNGSTDGTLEYLMEQEDAEILYNTIQFNSIRKTAWINKAVSYIGIHRWYVVVDSDEFLAYPEMEEYRLPEYVDRLKKKGITSIKTLMLEMYPDGSFFDTRRRPENFMEEYVYYDLDGRMHERVFGIGDGALRSKISLLYYDGTRFATGAHDFYPFTEYRTCRWGGVVKHYKFLSNEEEKIKKIVESGVYANNSSLYRKYQKAFENNEGLNPKFEGSHEWKGVDAFADFPFIEKLSE